MILSLCLLDQAGLQPYLFWLDDPYSRRWTGADQETVDDVLRAGSIWLASDGEQATSLVLASVQEDGSLAITLIVHPELRERGYGHQTLMALRGRVAGPLIAAIQRDHSASLRCFQGCGYVQIEAHDASGYALYAN